MSATVSLTLSGVGRIYGPDFRGVLDLARAADDAGVDQIVVPDHIVMGSRTDRYPFGTFPYGPDEPWPEPITLLAAIAAVTERVRLGTGILITPLRPPALLAKMVAGSHGGDDATSGDVRQSLDRPAGEGADDPEPARCGDALR